MMRRISLLICVVALSALKRDSWCCSATATGPTPARLHVALLRSWPGEPSVLGAAANRHRMQSHHRMLAPLSASALVRLRGGASEIATGDDRQQDLPLVAAVLRAIVRYLLAVIELISPTLAKTVQSFIESTQSALGLDLLPKQPKAKASKRRSKRQSTKAAKAESCGTGKQRKDRRQSDKRKTDAVSPVETVNIHSKARERSKQADSKTSAPRKGATSKTQEHLRTPIKSSSPNYRIQRELKQFIQEPPPNLTVKVGKNIRVWIVTMKGAAGSIYEGETFQLRIQFPPQYPTVPPSVYFLPPHIPLHEHVYTNGDICLSLLGKDWRPTMTAQSIAVSIQSILNSAIRKELPMDNAHHAHNKPGQYQKDWVYHDDNC